ncbi:aminotransferase class I/II-fold pyridoxal phosphate-dependent enzyme [Alphaproteobacteria bacterium]|nr:aminotransferase class I/II-fold pyridoxal phosphate-dependent enzyme [Alphaproteobacteria bacterium]
MINKPKPADSIQSLVSYRPAFGKNVSKSLIRLSANENGLGCSPLVNQAIRKYEGEIHRYPPQQDEALVSAISSRFKINPERIVTGNGSDELIYLLCTAFLNPGDEAIHTQYGFLVFPQAIKIAGGVPVVAQDDHYTVSVDSIIAKLSPKTKIVFLANPNNPTGTMLSEQEIKRLVDLLPKSVLLVLDWAYSEYVTEGLADAAQLVDASENIVMLRTFSKLFGLASLRLGWGYFPSEIYSILQSIRPPFSVNQLAALAGRIAIEDIAFQEESVSHNHFWMKEIVDRLDEMGVQTHPSKTNFMLLDFKRNTGLTAKLIETLLIEHNIQLRSMSPYGLPDMLRMSIGKSDEMEQLTMSLRQIMQQQGR